jgi:hypothetical protein
MKIFAIFIENICLCKINLHIFATSKRYLNDIKTLLKLIANIVKNCFGRSKKNRQ